MPRNPRLPEEGYADPVSYWAVQGGSGWLNILRRLQQGGIIFPDQQERDLVFLCGVLHNIIATNRGEPQVQLPGGASGSVAKHFQQ